MTTMIGTLPTGLPGFETRTILLSMSDAWLLLAVKYAQGDRDEADRSDVLRAAEFINHAHLLEDELAHAIKVLGESDLVQVNGDRFSLGPAFPDFWARSGAGKHRSVHKQLEKLEVALAT